MTFPFQATPGDRLVDDLRALLDGPDTAEDSLAAAYAAYQNRLVEAGTLSAARPTPAYRFNAAEEDQPDAYPYVRLWIDGYYPAAGETAVGVGPTIWEYTLLIEVVDRVAYDPSRSQTALEQLTRAVDYHAEPLRALLIKNRNLERVHFLEVQDVQYTSTAQVDSALYRSVIFTLLLHAS